MQKHKFNFFPNMNPEDYTRLKNDMATHGYDPRHPIIKYQGAILDGWHRNLASDELGIKPVVVEFQGTDSEALDYVIRTNNRRNLTSSQWAAVAVEAEEIFKTFKNEAKERQGKRNDLTLDNKLSEVKKDEHSSKAATKVAEAFNTNRTYVNEATKLKEENPEIYEEIKNGSKTITQANREIKEQKKEERRKENAEKVNGVTTIDKIGAKFSTIVIDPPWDWGDEGDCDQLGRAKPDYTTMSIEQLETLPVKDLADEDCHIYMWITNRSLPKGFRLLSVWGFRYITCLTWPKPSFGMGNYFRGQTEQILFGVKGSQMLKRKDAPTILPQWARGKGGHSSKPSEFLEFVESCSYGPYIELFSRSNRDGWINWGESSK
jgi:N6-adenosine-specific RNA methylase IME4